MAERPMAQEELIAKLGLPVIDRKPAQPSKAEIVLSLPADDSDEPPTLELEPLRCERRVVGWRIRSEDVQEGVSVSALEGPTELGDDPTVEIPARLPDDERPLARPFAGEPEAVRTLRRRNGRRVAPDYVFFPDDREVYFPFGYPWKCVGRLDVRPLPKTAPDWVKTGTASLIGARTIITAAHVYPWGLEALVGEKPSIKFTAALYNGASVYGKSSYVVSVYNNAHHEQGDDVTVMQLVLPLGKNYGSFGVKTYSDAWEGFPYWTRCGYADVFSNGNRPNRQQWFSIQDDDSDGDGWELEYEADTTSGDSGGPVFGWWDGVPCIIGVHSGGEQEAFDTNNVAAGGPFMTNMVKWAWDHWE